MPRAYRQWSFPELRRAHELRAAGKTFADIEQAMGRSRDSIRSALVRAGLLPTAGQRGRPIDWGREAQLRRALTLLNDGASYPEVMSAVGWTASKPALWQALRLYGRRGGIEPRRRVTR